MLSHAEVSTARIIPDEKLAGLFGL
jgi:hypothetical protein